MNISTALQFDSISLPAWTATTIRHTRQAAAQTSVIIKAFSKSYCPSNRDYCQRLEPLLHPCVVQGAGTSGR